jgi:hypothetical protein
MRYIKAPEAVLLPGASEKLSFATFIREVLAGDKRWFSTLDYEDAFDAITTAAEGLPDGGVFEIQDKHLEKLEACAREYAYAPHIKVALKPFVRAITRAFPKDPREPEKKAAKAESE